MLTETCLVLLHCCWEYSPVQQQCGLVELGELGPEVGEDSQGPVGGGHLILPESLADVLAELD